jgi:hypothetical protein
MAQDIYANVYEDTGETDLVFSTGAIKGFGCSTQLPGGFAEGSFTLPALFFDPAEWKTILLNKFVVITDGSGDRIYEGSIDGVSDTDDGLSVKLTGHYARASLQTVFLTYPTAPVPLVPVVQELSDLVNPWRSRLFNRLYTTAEFESPVALEFMYETKVAGALEKILSENANGSNQVQFAVYDYARPMLFESLEPWFTVSRHNLVLRYGSTISLAGVYNRIQVIYDVEGEKRVTDWFENERSQHRYGVREGSMNVGSVPEGVAQVAGELAIARYAYPDEQETFTINGQVYSYYTHEPLPVHKLRAGHMLFVSDLPANPESRYAFAIDRDQAGFLVQRTTYNHDDASLSFDVGEATKSLEQYLVGMGVSGGSVQ